MVLLTVEMMMSEVKRYESGVYYCSGDAMVQGEDGDYVKHSDYAALKAECESNLKSAQYSAETNRKISRKNGEMHEEILSLKAERDALAAEVTAIREQAECVYAAGYNHGHLNTVDGIAYAPTVKDEFYHNALQVVLEVETPTTEAYANQLRAEGVEMFAAHLRTDKTETSVCKMIALGADEFAANLRKGQQ